MAKKKVSRKQLLNEPDEFITLSSKVIQWCRQNPKPLIYGAGAVVVVIALVVGITTYNNYRSRAAFDLLAEVTGRVDSLVSETEGDVDLSKVEADFNRLITTYDGQTAGRMGRVMFAHLQLTNGSADKAIELYKAALSDFKKDPSLANIIYNGLASAYEKQGMTAEAIENYEKITKGESKLLKDQALFHLGRLYSQAGEGEKSSQVYDQLISDFPESLFTPLAKEVRAG